MLAWQICDRGVLAAKRVKVAGEEALAEALKSPEDMEVVLSNDIIVNKKIRILGNKRLNGQGCFKIIRGDKGADSGKTLLEQCGGVFVLEEVTIDGAGRNKGAGQNMAGRLIEVRGGTLILNNKTVLTHNYNIMSIGEGGGAICLKRTAKAMLKHGSTVKDNMCVCPGAGVLVEKGATLINDGGVICDNVCFGRKKTGRYAGIGGGVANYGTFIMKDGAIRQNVARGYKYKSNGQGGLGNNLYNAGEVYIKGGSAIAGMYDLKAPVGKTSEVNRKNQANKTSEVKEKKDKEKFGKAREKTGKTGEKSDGKSDGKSGGKTGSKLHNISIIPKPHNPDNKSGKKTSDVKNSSGAKSEKVNVKANGDKDKRRKNDSEGAKIDDYNSRISANGKNINTESSELYNGSHAENVPENISDEMYYESESYTGNIDYIYEPESLESEPVNTDFAKDEGDYMSIIYLNEEENGFMENSIWVNNGEYANYLKESEEKSVDQMDLSFTLTGEVQNRMEAGSCSVDECVRILAENGGAYTGSEIK